jgi:DNA-binding transcriptional LysR family regulator
MERISDISLFLRVVDLGSISAAARSENLSLAVASKRIQRLEESLGARLLNRTTRRLYPTPEGELLASQGRPLIEALNALGECLHTSRSEVTGTIRVTMSASFGRLFSPLLAEFQSLHPDVNFVAHLSDEVVDLVKGDTTSLSASAILKTPVWWRDASPQTDACWWRHRPIWRDVVCRSIQPIWLRMTDYS